MDSLLRHLLHYVISLSNIFCLKNIFIGNIEYQNINDSENGLSIMLQNIVCGPSNRHLFIFIV